MSNHDDIAKKLDERLMELLLNGRPVLDKEGNAVLDLDGQPLMQPPSAADLNVVRARLKDLGVRKNKEEREDPMAALKESIGELKLAGIDDDKLTDEEVA